MLTRRDFLNTAAIGAGAAGVALSLSLPARADASLSKSQAGYQESPKGSQRCGLCKKFKPPTACNLVAGPINPNGWCNFFSVTG